MSMLLPRLFAAALVAGSLTGFMGCAPEAKPAAAPPPPKVLVSAVSQRNVELFAETVGQLDGYVNAEIRARVRGYLKAQSYRDGSTVQAGQLLFTIDPQEYQAALESARGTLARAHAAVQLSKAQYARTEALLQSGTTTPRALEDALASRDDAIGQERAAQAAVRQAELNLSYTQVRSPVEGMAGLALVRVGNLVGADGPTLLTTVSSLDPMRVRFPISEREYLKNAQRYRELSGHDLAWTKAQFAKLDSGEPVAPGEEGVELVLADDSTYKKRGLIVATDREINPSTGTIEVEALFPNPDGILRPGQYGRVRMRRADAGKPAIVVAQKALLEVQGTYSVAVLGDGNKVELRRVEVGEVTGDERVITKGLSAGERIVVEGVQKVSDGAQVVPQDAPTRAAFLGSGENPRASTLAE
jgi:membrane fusion protein, multidrug efflux system